MSSLTAIFGNSEEKTEDSDKLMELYWNRAELKKEFAGMRKERYRLQDRIKEQEGKTARIQQKVDHLEHLLADPDWAHNVVVFYQLRGLGKKSERKLARFAEKLKQQREQKKRKSLLVDWNEECKVEAQAVKEQIVLKRDLVQQLEDQLQSEQRRLTSMNAFTRLFRGRSAMKHIDSLATQLEVTVQEAQLLHNNLEELMNRKPPDHQGLDIATKRSINLFIIAFAQQLYIQFDKAGIAGLVKESTEKGAGAINYGTHYECQQIIERIHKSIERLEQVTESADLVKKRAMMLGERAKFSGNDDVVPAPESVASLIRIDANGRVGEKDLNIAGENYWGIWSVFSR
ncbi:MAG: hypothetical protein P8M18_12090 [Woeseiaceae bacterium]|nr:hypothetical protein [Woeseiaceae bacterium]